MGRLSDAKIRQTKVAGKPQKLSDGSGLYLLITPAGAKSWRFRFARGGREQVITLGHYPDVGLAESRRRRDTALAAVREGQDPTAALRPPEVAPARTLEDEARAWHEAHRRMWAPHHASDVLESLAREVFPVIGAVAIEAVTAPQILAVLRPVEARGAVELAHRLRQRLSAVLDYAVALGHAPANPAASLRRALAPVVRTGRRPAVATLEDARAVLQAAEAVPAHPVTRLALRLLALTAVRPGELRGARWEEFAGLDGPEPVWTIPADRMKGTVERRADTPDHVVPLAPAAVEALQAVRSLTGRGPLPFPSWRRAHQPLSENAIGYLMHRAGFQGRQTAHGWRATFSTVMNDLHPGDQAVIDLMLAHVPAGAVERAYNRALHLARRREIAEEWAGMLMEGMPPAAELLRLPRK